MVYRRPSSYPAAKSAFLEYALAVGGNTTI
jgi:hypothetical protein